MGDMRNAYISIRKSEEDKPQLETYAYMSG